jgi:hypothetical protein
MNEAYIAPFDMTVQIGDWFYRADEPLYEIVGINQVRNSDDEVVQTDLMVRSLDGTYSLQLAESILYTVIVRDEFALDLRHEGPNDEITDSADWEYE